MCLLACWDGLNKITLKTMPRWGSGCGPVGNVVASDTRRTQFEYRHRQFSEHFSRKDKINEIVIGNNFITEIEIT